jgi:hypothetical protein
MAKAQSWHRISAEKNVCSGVFIRRVEDNTVHGSNLFGAIARPRPIARRDRQAGRSARSDRQLLGQETWATGCESGQVRGARTARARGASANGRGGCVDCPDRGGSRAQQDDGATLAPGVRIEDTTRRLETQHDHDGRGAARCRTAGMLSPWPDGLQASIFEWIQMSQVPFGSEKARAEASKCVLLCANCHAEVEAGMIQVA